MKSDFHSGLGGRRGSERGGAPTCARPGAARRWQRQPPIVTVTLSPRNTITPSPVPAAIRGCRRGKSHEWENGSSGSAAASPARLTSDVPRGSASLRPPAMWVQILHPTTATTRPAPLRGSPGHRTAGGEGGCVPLGLQLRETAAVGAAVPTAAHAPRADIPGMGWMQTLLFHRRPCPAPRPAAVPG